MTETKTSYLLTVIKKEKMWKCEVCNVFLIINTKIAKVRIQKLS